MSEFIQEQFKAQPSHVRSLLYLCLYQSGDGQTSSFPPLDTIEEVLAFSAPVVARPTLRRNMWWNPKGLPVVESKNVEDNKECPACTSVTEDHIESSRTTALNMMFTTLECSVCSTKWIVLANRTC
eukprot:PhM_4_TR10662/c0_g1_i1/m.21113